ncbi:uncharacterized protein RCC_08736 [Ramularia collo-cygni]|uniref:Uncharacterized protein n=1 Tax=Ramularia collo-cygni TaxID=112498 RepID=A0A2D3V0W3_9PEZI|nr:uncharacterized protein RCC_08736 [Ramularia collo-cygni]CZT23026.1 uncharacterized protein RCC_08736 [Ramularia collo-cygni]
MAMSIASIIDDFERAALLEPEPSAEQIANGIFADIAHCASKGVTTQSAQDLFDLCFARFSRGRPGIDFSQHAFLKPSMTYLLTAIEQLARRALFEGQPSRPEDNRFDVSNNVFADRLDNYIADFESHGRNAQLLNSGRTNQVEPVDSPRTESVAEEAPKSTESEDDDEPSEDDSGSDSDEDTIRTLPQFSPPPPAPTPATPPKYHFEYINWKGETSSSDYSERYQIVRKARAPVRMSRDGVTVTTLAAPATRPAPQMGKLVANTGDLDRSSKFADTMPRTTKMKGAATVLELRNSFACLEETVVESPVDEAESICAAEVNAALEELSVASDTVQQGSEREEEVSFASISDDTAESVPVTELCASLPSTSDRDVPVQTSPARIPSAAHQVMPNFDMVEVADGEKKRKGERKYRSFANLGISFTVSLKKTTTKPTIVVLLDASSDAAVRDLSQLDIAGQSPTDTPGESVLIVRLGSPMKEAKTELRIESLAHMMETAAVMKVSAKKMPVVNGPSSNVSGQFWMWVVLVCLLMVSVYMTSSIL